MHYFATDSHVNLLPPSAQFAGAMFVPTPHRIAPLYLVGGGGSPGRTRDVGDSTRACMLAVPIIEIGKDRVVFLQAGNRW